MEKNTSNIDRESLIKLLTTVIQELDVGIHVVNKNGETILYNNKMSTIESMNAKDVIGKNIREVFEFPNEQTSTLLQALEEKQTTKNVKQQYFNNKGEEIITINHTFPFVDNDKLEGAFEIAKDVTKIEKLIRQNRQNHNTRYSFDSIIGTSSAIKEVIENAKRVTRTPSSVLITGETGTGKEIFAQSIHNGSERAHKPFISQNCAALPDSLIEGLLFGTKRGAFTGAADHPGLFEQAEGGTLLLDEINSLNPNLQAKLLRAIQEKTIRRVGDTKDLEIDVRIISTINEDPISAISEGRLRKDLYYRLSVVSLFIPPLRERLEDIKPLMRHFIELYNYKFQMNVKGVANDILHHLYNYDWPGNVRELEHIVEAAMNLMMDEEEITMTYLPRIIQQRILSTKEDQVGLEPLQPKVVKQNPKMPLKAYLEKMEEQYVKSALSSHDGNISRAANALGLSRQNLQYRIRKIKNQQNAPLKN
ncbi:sigma-54 interaction domain-containing protein [Alkalihalobacterium elongatum]|uniref:sigma-54 interaction domain-containing protein n=1 Tax=Alkalihalobacterium elongatum TaxID=2675466 RepID=UPI001C1F888C|nr:sigma 54-interacting transcriptional regulator [Alkalihalobacterium elongatum]